MNLDATVWKRDSFGMSTNHENLKKERGTKYDSIYEYDYSAYALLEIPTPKKKHTHTHRYGYSQCHLSGCHYFLWPSLVSTSACLPEHNAPFYHIQLCEANDTYHTVQKYSTLLQSAL